MQPDNPDTSGTPGEAEPIDAEFEPARPERRSTAGLARAGGIAMLLVMAGGLGGAAGWLAAGQNAPAAGPDAEAQIARLESQLAGLNARLNAAEDRPLTEMVPAEALRTFDGEIRALAERLDAAEARPAGEAAAQVDTAALDALLDARLAALRAELDDVRALAERAASTGSADGVDLRPVTEALEALDTRLTARIERVETDMAAMADRQSASAREALDALGASEERMLARITALEARSDEESREARTGAEAVERSAARILAFTALRETAQTSESFEAERANLARLWPNAPGLATLQPHARRGVASADELAASFPVTAINAASGETRRFFGLFELRPADSAPDSALALTRQAQSRLARGDLSGAVEAASRLEGAPAEAASDWLAQARARLEIDAALATLRNALSDTTPGRSTP